MTHFNWVDVVLVILFLRMGYVGFRNGIAAELIKLAGVLVGLFVSFRYYQGLGDALAGGTFLSPEWASALVMTCLVVLLYIGVVLAFRLLEKVVQLNFHPKVKSVGGLLVGLTRAVLVTSVILVVCLQFRSPYMESSIEQQSFSGHAVSRVAPAVYDAATPVLGHLRK